MSLKFTCNPALSNLFQDATQKQSLRFNDGGQNRKQPSQEPTKVGVLETRMGLGDRL